MLFLTIAFLASALLSFLDHFITPLVSLKSLFQNVWASSSIDGNEANDWFDKGVEFINSGDYGQAVEAFDNVLELEPENVDALNRINVTEFS